MFYTTYCKTFFSNMNESVTKARKDNSITTALEISSAFSKFSPEDPVKYDFALTRFGIRGEMDEEMPF